MGGGCLSTCNGSGQMDIRGAASRGERIDRSQRIYVSVHGAALPTDMADRACLGNCNQGKSPLTLR